MPNERRLSVHNWLVVNRSRRTLHCRRVWFSHRTSRLQIRHTRGKAVVVVSRCLRQISQLHNAELPGGLVKSSYCTFLLIISSTTTNQTMLFDRLHACPNFWFHTFGLVLPIKAIYQIYSWYVSIGRVGSVKHAVFQVHIQKLISNMRGFRVYFLLLL